MGTIVLVAQILGRQNTSSRTIVLAASLMLLHNPFLLLYDVGFQLSFLASLGIIHGKPMFDVGLNKIGEKFKFDVGLNKIDEKFKKVFDNQYFCELK